MAERSARIVRVRVWLLLAWVLFGCRTCGDETVGELIVANAQVDRDFSAAQSAWSAAKPGDKFSMGDGLRTGPHASAQLGLARGGRLLVNGDTTMRFTRSLSGPEQERRIEVAQGEITVETGQLDIGISTQRGIVRLSPASQVQVRAEAGKMRFDVLVGRVEYAEPSGSHVVNAGSGLAVSGQGFDITVLKATVEKGEGSGAAGSPAPAPKLAAAEETVAGMGTALRDLRFQDPPPSAAVSLPLGESASVHDPLPPTDVRIATTRCPALAIVEWDRGNGRFDALRARGTAEVRMRLPVGNYRYRVRCVRDGRIENASAGSGKLSIVRDVATRPLPSQPVAITADADGRRYTVSYQNRLPVITLRWPEPPPSSAYTLTVTPESGKPFSTHSGKPSVTLAAGRLSEGMHGFQFEAAGKRSEQGWLRVAFDYKARTGYLTSPVEGQRIEGSSRVSGGTLIGSSVQILGVPTKVDSQGRFAAELSVPASARALAVRVQHPSAGVHYYVRHLVRSESASPP